MAEKLYTDVDPLFSHYLNKWSVLPIDEPMFRHSSCLLPVKMTDERPAMLKIALEEREKSGGIMMQCWEGKGAAQVYACEGNALLMEYAQGRNSLVDMAMNGYDDEASLIGCQVIAQLHEPSVSEPPSQLLPLQDWFESLEHVAQKEGAIFIECSKTAQFLLAEQQDIVILHGDVHHENILDFGSRGWLAIDPKGLLGERGYDYANLLCNPRIRKPDQFINQVNIITQAANLEKRRFLQWILAYAGLAASWFLEDDQIDKSKGSLIIADMALKAIDSAKSVS